MTDTTLPQTRAGILARIHVARARLEAAIAGADEQALNAPGPDGWSVKDHLAHLAAWQRFILARLQGRPAHEVVGMDPAAFEAADEEGINAALQARSHRQPLAGVRAEFQQTHQALLEAIEQMPDAQLAAPYAPAAEASWAEAIAGNSFGHDEQHLPWIERLL